MKKIIQQLDQFKNLKTIYLVGLISEPTLYQEFKQLCQYLTERKIAIELYTNGNTHDEDWWQELGKNLTFNGEVEERWCPARDDPRAIFSITLHHN